MTDSTADEADVPPMTSREKGVPPMTSREKGGFQGTSAEIPGCTQGEDEDLYCEDNNEDEDPVYEPPDGGWGWKVIFGTTICTMVMATQGPCFGIFYGDRLRELGGTPTLAAWLFNFQSLTWNLAGPWAGPLSEKFGYRPVAMVAACMAVSSLMFSASVTNPYGLLFTFSMFSGIGGGICINCCYHMSAKYFKRRLGLANGIMVTGGSVGLMLMPQLASRLQQNYPFEWANLIAGAVMMNSVAATLLFHPVEWHAKRVIPEARQNGKPYLVTAENEQRLSPDNSKKNFLSIPNESSPDGFTRSASVPQRLQEQDIQNQTPEMFLRRKRTRSETPDVSDWNQGQGKRSMEFQIGGNSKASVLQYSGSTLMGSVLTLQHQHLPNQNNENDTKNDRRSYRKKAVNQGIWKKFLSHYQPSVLREPLVIPVALFTCVTITAALNVFSTMPFVLNDEGYSLQSAASAMSVAAVADLVTRIVCAIITDRPWVNTRVLYGIAQVIFIAIPFVLFSMLDHWWVVLACMSSMGVGLGILYTLDVLIIIRLLGVQKLQPVFGMSQLFRAFAFLSLGPLGGVLRDVTGTYASAIFFYTGAIFMALILMLFTVLYTYRSSRSKTQPKPI